MKQFLLFNFIIFLSFSAFTQPLTKDTNTLLLLKFDESLKGADNEMPMESRNISYDIGKHGKALSFGINSFLSYSTVGNIDTRKGTIEFWCKPKQKILTSGTGTK